MIKSKLVLLIGVQTFLFLSIATAGTASEEFRILSSDGQVELRGQFDLPVSSRNQKTSWPLVVMVPGTGLFERDVLFGNSGTDRDFLFRDLSRALNKRGFATLRFDQRGVFCHQRNQPPCLTCRTSEERMAHFVKSCIDQNIRSRVTPESMRRDILDVIRHGLQQPWLRPDGLTVFGHSEGSLHLSHLMGLGLLRPQRAVFMGGLAESPFEVVRWQMTTRLVEALFQMDTNRDGFVTREEIQTGHATAPLLSLYPIETLLPPAGSSWTRDAFGAILQSQYESLRQNLAKTPDDSPFGQNGLVQASMRWWKMFFFDEVSPAFLLRSFRGRVIYAMGNLDSQTALSRQLQALRAVGPAAQVRFEVAVFPARGHSLGPDPLFGPIAPDSLERLIKLFEN